MKKSIAFIGALLFGSVTFGQVSKNDTINKPSSRKVSADDLKKFPADTQNAEIGGIKIKGERGIKAESQKSDYLKVSPDNSARIKGSGMTIKGKGNDASISEKQHYTIKMTTANQKMAVDSSKEDQVVKGEHIAKATLIKK